MHSFSSVRGTVYRIDQFVRNGNTYFALAFERHMPLDGHDKDQVLTINVKDCPLTMAAALSLVRPKDYVMLDYDEHQVSTGPYRLWAGIMVTQEPALRVRPVLPD